MYYTPYVSPDIIKSRIYGLVNTGGTSNSFSSTSGGIGITDDEINLYQMQGESVAQSYLSTVYKIPIVSIAGGTTLDSFNPITAGNLLTLFINATLIQILDSTFLLGAARKDMELSSIKKRMLEIVNFIMGKDSSGGIIIPSWVDLQLSGAYLTRQQNQVPTTVFANTPFTAAIDNASQYGITKCPTDGCRNTSEYGW